MMGLMAVSRYTLICTMNSWIQVFLKMFWRVVSVGDSAVLLPHDDLLSPVSHHERLHSNLIGLVSHVELLGVLVLDVLVGSKGGASCVLLLHVWLLSLGSVHLHDDLLGSCS